MSQTEYRAVLIGLGFMGAGDQIAGDKLGQQVKNLDGTHLEALCKHPQVKLVAGSDLQEDRRDRFAKRTGAAVYPDWREMLEKERPEIVSVATNSPYHAEITIAAAEAGAKAVYCEKPMATRLNDADRMIAVCKQTGTLLVINHNRRFNPNYRRLRDAIAEGLLGDLTSCNLQWATGRLGNVGTHIIDAVQMLTNKTVQSVSGTLDLTGRPDCRGSEYRDPGVWGVLRLEGGLMVTVDGPDMANLPVCLAINGTKGRAITGGGDVTIRLHAGSEDHWPSTREKSTSMDNAMREIVATLDEGVEFPYPPQEAIRALEAIVGFHMSHDQNAVWVELPLTGSNRDREVKIG
jgi:predicted dehydrogenase